MVTCSGGDAAVSADLADTLHVPLPPLSAPVCDALTELLPDAATIGNPLDYTALIWGDSPLIGDIVATVGRDDAVGQVLAYYDEPQDMDDASAASWAATLDGIADGAHRSAAGALVCSTLPDLLPEPTIDRLHAQGVPGLWGLRTGLIAAHALSLPFADATRLRQIAEASASVGAPGEWLAEHDAKNLLNDYGVGVPAGRLAITSDEAVSAAKAVGFPVALKLTSATLQHKSDVGALALGLQTTADVEAAVTRLRSLPGQAQTPLLVERMASPGVEVMVAAHRDGVVPALVIALGGIWVEVLEDAVVLPLPVTASQVTTALQTLRAAPLLFGGRGRAAVNVDALAELAARVGQLFLEERLQLIELNPVFVTADGAVAVDAVARRTSG